MIYAKVSQNPQYKAQSLCLSKTIADTDRSPTSTESFWPQIQQYTLCNQCQNYDICGDCFIGDKISTTSDITHATCPNNPSWTCYLHPEISMFWVNEQTQIVIARQAEAEAIIEQEQREEAEATEAEAAAAAQRAAVEAERSRQRQLAASEAAARQRQADAAAKARTLAAQTPRVVRAPSPAPPQTTSRHLAPARPTQQRRKSSSGLGTALLGFGKAVLNAEVAANRNNGGFGGGGGGMVSNNNFVGGNGGGMDMSSFWSPINDAANDPIQ